MKKLLSLSLLLYLVATTSLWAYDFQADDLYYNIINNSRPYIVEVTSKNSSYPYNDGATFTSVTIPETVTYGGNTYKVISIGDWAFAGCYYLTSVTIPSSVKGVGDNAFYGCSSLTSITLPNGVTSIGNWAFDGCSRLTSITIPNSVTSIGEGAFRACSSLTSMVVDSSNTTYDSRNNCNAIIETATNTLIAGCQNTFIPYSVTSIGDEAFNGCSSLTSITIPNGVTSIGYEAFAGCSALISIVVDLGNIIYDSRNNCNAIIETATNTLIVGCKNTIIPNSVKNIGGDAFFGCSSLTSITIPNGVTSIGYEAFCGCSSLTSVSIGNSVTSIGVEAFYGCCFTSITIPNSVTSIGYCAFPSSTLTSIVVERGNTAYDSRNNCNAIIETATNTLITGCQNTIIPKSVTSIGRGAFVRCSFISITIPIGVTSIGAEAFLGCSSLASIIIPNSVTNVKGLAFSGCSALKYISIPKSVTSIGIGTFMACSALTSITIPNSVTNIGRMAFKGCSSLDTVICFAMVPPVLGEDVFYGCDDATLFVPCEALSDYQAHEQWGQFATIECISSKEVETEAVTIESGTTTIMITWPTETGADTYTIVIQKGDEVFCTLTFNAEGQLLNIAFTPGRNGNHPVQYAEQAGNGYRFTITGLEDGTDYTYDIVVKNEAGKVIKTHSGKFTTIPMAAVDNIHSPLSNNTKLIRDGQLIIIRDGKTYNAQGALLK